MKYSVLVPTFLRPEMLRRNLEAIALQSKLPDEILVAIRPEEDPEGISTVQDFQSAKPDLSVRKIEVLKPGIVPAENALIQAATGDVACFLDDDALPRPFWLAKISRHYEKDSRIGGVSGPAIDVVNGKALIRRARFRNRVYFPGIILDQSTRHTNRSLQVDHFRGANMSFRLDVLRKSGGFDENLLGDCFRFELDACFQIRNAGLRLVFDPEVEADHHEAPRHGGKSRHDPKTIYNNAANETYVLLKQWGRGPKGCLHMISALLLGNFPCPGILWAITGTLLRPLTSNRHLLGIRFLIPALRGRFRGWHMAAKLSNENL
ncbi:MAG: glycosyltransferase [Planctomycetota bacterium]|nr:glycosyltransferase [Planctomycetota bacterium]